MLAYSVQWHLAEAWKPLLFADEAPANEAREHDPVAPATRSAAALAKAQSRRLADGAPALSFRGLLTHLATIVRNTMRPRDAKPGTGTFTLTTEANPKHRQALDLAAALPRPSFQSQAIEVARETSIQLQELRSKTKSHRRVKK